MDNYWFKSMNYIRHDFAVLARHNHEAGQFSIYAITTRTEGTRNFLVVILQHPTYHLYFHVYFDSNLIQDWKSYTHLDEKPGVKECEDPLLRVRLRIQVGLEKACGYGMVAATKDLSPTDLSNVVKKRLGFTRHGTVTYEGRLDD